MGSWGTALYSNDTSSDVRDMANEVYPLVGIEEGTRLIFEEYADVMTENDNDCADFWFALADWQWRHGILTDDIKEKAITLLEAHTGIDEWEKFKTAADVQRRLAVMDKLLTQLSSPMPRMNIPKAKIAKPKHKPGDIIIARTCSSDHSSVDFLWSIERCTYPYIYKSETADRLPELLKPPFTAYDKYIAILCVDTEKMPHSQYIEGIYDEHSVYAFYDYVSDEKPTADRLKKCGFLPKYLRYASTVGTAIETIGWTYTFKLFTYSFRISKNSFESSVEHFTCKDEYERFSCLFSMKDYLSEPSYNFELHDAFSDFFEGKAILSAAGIGYDNLLDKDSENPPICSADEILNLIKTME